MLHFSAHSRSPSMLLPIMVDKQNNLAGQAYPGEGGGGIPCLGKSEPTNAGATKPVPSLQNERTNCAGLAKVAYEKQWMVAVISWWTFLVHQSALLSAPHEMEHDK